jgi:N-acetylornithine carbamoyltransferase
MPDIVGMAEEQARKYKTNFEIVEDVNGMDIAFKDADVIYAKSWGAMVHTPDANKGAEIIKKYEHWITDERKMGLAKPDAIYMHPLPADRNIEVTDGVIDGPNSVVYDEAENRLHAQKAILAWCLGV